MTQHDPDRTAEDETRPRHDEDEPSAEEIVEEAGEDPITRREAAEQELLEADRSEEGESVGEHIE